MSDDIDEEDEDMFFDAASTDSDESAEIGMRNNEIYVGDIAEHVMNNYNIYAELGDDYVGEEDPDFIPIIMLPRHELNGAEGGEPSNSSSDSEGENEPYELSLPTRHEYLGATEEVRGRTVPEDDEYMTIPILLHSTLMNIILMPNQTLPLCVAHPLLRSIILRAISINRLVGIVHTQIGGRTSQMVQFGTTAEIYECDNSDSMVLSVKAKGRHRFKVIDVHREVTGCVEAKVKILPEIQMPDPFYMIRSNSLQKLNLSKHSSDDGKDMHISNAESLRTRQGWIARKRSAILTPWPSWLYDQYDDCQLALQLVKQISSSFNLTKIPHDPRELSHWAAINLPLSDAHKLNLLSLNTPTQRLRYILSVSSQCFKNQYLCCTFCGRTLASTSNIFCMSLEGPQGTFVNPRGYVHEMFTVSKATGIVMRARPSIEHSWFPEYSWTIADCSNCFSHVGWQFRATKDKLKPSSFFGITRKAVKIKLLENEEAPDPNKYVI